MDHLSGTSRGLLCLGDRAAATKRKDTCWLANWGPVSLASATVLYSIVSRVQSPTPFGLLAAVAASLTAGPARCSNPAAAVFVADRLWGRCAPGSLSTAVRHRSFRSAGQ